MVAVQNVALDVLQVQWPRRCERLLLCHLGPWSRCLVGGSTGVVEEQIQGRREAWGEEKGLEKGGDGRSSGLFDI